MAPSTVSSQAVSNESDCVAVSAEREQFLTVAKFRVQQISAALSRHLKQRREELGLTVELVAEISEIPMVRVKTLEAGRAVVHPDEISALCFVLHIGLDDSAQLIYRCLWGATGVISPMSEDQRNE